MNGVPHTPRLRSAFPQTPQNSQRRGLASPTPSIDDLQPKANDDNSPLIPFDLVDAPSQRLYVLTFYIGLHAWRFYDYWNLVADDTESTWLFLKWITIDGVFLFGLPGLRIPWMEWSFMITMTVFLLHSFFDGVLMFRIPVPSWIWAWFMGNFKLLWDRELAVSERKVKPADIINNASLILGKQIIHILPEGSAILNQENEPFCIGPFAPSIELPITINQTTPILIELLRIDLDTNQNETIIISKKETNQLKKRAEKLIPKKDQNDPSKPRTLKYTVKKPGLYQLRKVVDESKLEVQRRLSDTLIVNCPKAVIRAPATDKCHGELSDLVLEVHGTPPLKIKYSRTINQEDHISSFQSIQPENLISPLVHQQSSRTLIDPRNVDVSWAREQKIEVPMNESLGTIGNWLYAIEEVHDACGNIVKYETPHEDNPRAIAKYTPQRQRFSVHERPRAMLNGCDPQDPLYVAAGRTERLPLRLARTGQPQPVEWPLKVSYFYEPQPEDPDDPLAFPRLVNVTFKNDYDYHRIKHAGWYTLKTVATPFCQGEILEPATCLLINPPEPDLHFVSEEIHDKCAGDVIGLLVDLDMIGTPPFNLYYNIRHDGEVTPRIEKIERMRHQLELTPPEAGHYTYEFLELEDSVYGKEHLKQKEILEQNVKPPASAHFVDVGPNIKACIEEPVSARVRLIGQAPWTLQYELVYGNKRTKHELKSAKEYATITTDKLTKGGEYSLSLSSITDRTGCKKFLEGSIKLDVRHTRPKAAFGKLEGKFNILTLQGKNADIPLRLTGEAPWFIRYRNRDNPTGREYDMKVKGSNDFLRVGSQGTWEILEVQDATCPGSIDLKANSFSVSWIPRPSLQVPDPSVMEKGGIFVKHDVCQGDEDILELKLAGTPPYQVGYNHRGPDQGSIGKKEFTAGLGTATIRMDTSVAGFHNYEFSELGDYLYDHDPSSFDPTIIKQMVNPQPSARFAHPGKTYAYCNGMESDDEAIPIQFSGIPPFFLEIGIKHITSAKPEIISIPNINTERYNFHIPHQYLATGQSLVTIRKVRDTLGCQRRSEYEGSSVRVHVSDIPSIIPLESREDYCVGDFISYTLSGSPPFHIFYTFEGRDRKASADTTTFRRIADRAGNFTIMAISDGVSGCSAKVGLTKLIHQMPSVRISQGKESVVDIHEGGDAEILFEFGGTPPFEFTYTRSTNAQGRKKSQLLETKRDISYEYSKSVRASAEGTYEVVAIKDKFCAFSTQKTQPKSKEGYKLLKGG
ncbi:MAG: hypothetical protein M1834_008760 [Cirrosporium novae-zelandiae]|nr:MAG: hypothetical protein M1834_008760 [Cirrosporium novae-zelandiae]